MKKLLGSTLALAMIVPAGANAELLKNFKASGSLEVDAVSANNITDFRTDKYDHIGTAQTRLLLNADWDLLDDVHSRVTLRKNDRTYGNGGSQDVNTVTTKLFADQAYVKIDKLFGGLDTTLGRQFYGEAGDIVIYFGPKSIYGLAVTSLDGARFDWNGEKVGATALVAKQTGGALGAADTANVNINGLDFHVKPMDNVSGGAYVYERTTVNNGTPTGSGVIANDILWVAGLKAKATMGGAWLKGEFDKNFGQNRTVTAAGYTFTGNYTGWAAKVDTGYKAEISRFGTLTGWAEGGIGSGGNTTNSPNRVFTAIAGDYRPGGIYGRFAPYTSGTNPGELSSGGVATNTLSDRALFGFGLKATPAMLSKLTAGFSWWNYHFQSADGVPAAAKGNKFLGNEYDLDFTWAHSENVSVSAGVGTFQPGRAIIVSQGTVNPATLAYTDFSIKF